VRFAIADIESAVWRGEHAVRTIEPAAERIWLRPVATFPATEDGRNGPVDDVDRSDDVILSVSDVQQTVPIG
jgi:hypothetical protein